MAESKHDLHTFLQLMPTQSQFSKSDRATFLAVAEYFGLVAEFILPLFGVGFQSMRHEQVKLWDRIKLRSEMVVSTNCSLSALFPFQQYLSPHFGIFLPKPHLPRRYACFSRALFWLRVETTLSREAEGERKGSSYGQHTCQTWQLQHDCMSQRQERSRDMSRGMQFRRDLTL